ncbi:MAG: pectate lyase-like adhesive domain-containing protein, partial [Acidimicrobiia bacterium]
MTSGSFAALTLVAPPAGAVTVTDEATFRTAFTDANETSIVLGADITLTCGGGGAVFRGSASALTVDGAGHTITQSCADTDSLHQVSTGALTFTDVTFTGGDSAVFSTNGGAVSLTRVTVTGLASTSGGIIAVFTGGPLTVDQSTFRDFTAPDLVNIIAGQQGPVTVTASTISGLHATAGAALAVTSIAGPLSFTDSSVRDLTATDVAIAVSSNSGSVTL